MADDAGGANATTTTAQQPVAPQQLFWKNTEQEMREHFSKEYKPHFCAQ